MADVTNLVNWPHFHNGLTPPLDSFTNTWIACYEDSSGDLTKKAVTVVEGSEPAASYCYTNLENRGSSYYDPSGDVALGIMQFSAGAIDLSDATIFVDAMINSGITLTLKTSDAQDITGAETLGEILGDNTRKTYAIPVSSASTGAFIFLHGLMAKRGEPTHEIYGMRISANPIEDDLGVFGGDSVDQTGEITYSWAGEAYNSASVATSGGDDGGGDDGGGLTLSHRVMLLMNLDTSDEVELAQAEEVVKTITLMVKAYTRGRGFTLDDDGNQVITDDIQSVILTASNRYIANPSGLLYRAGSEQISSVFSGWTLAETFVLNNYRRRSA